MRRLWKNDKENVFIEAESLIGSAFLLVEKRGVRREYKRFEVYNRRIICYIILRKLKINSKEVYAMIKKAKNVWCWIFSVFCFMAVLAYGFHICSVVFLAAGVLTMPLPQLGTVWEKIIGNKGKWIKPLIIGGLFFAGVMLTPTTETVESNVNVIATETETVSIANTEETAVETEIIVLETEAVASETEIELVNTEEIPETEVVVAVESSETEQEVVTSEVLDTEVLETEVVNAAVVDDVTLNETTSENSAVDETTSDSSVDDENNSVENIAEPELKYAVNGKNGKIHIIGECAATGTGKNAMEEPVYFATYEEALAYSEKIKPGLDKRQCGNCW